MAKKNVIGFLYVSAWVIVWGTIGSLVDFPLLKANVYVPGSLGQILTFTITGILSVILSINIYPKIINNENA